MQSQLFAMYTGSCSFSVKLSSCDVMPGEYHVNINCEMCQTNYSKLRNLIQNKTSYPSFGLGTLELELLASCVDLVTAFVSFS